MSGGAGGLAGAVDGAGLESALEPTPGEAFRVQQVADVLPAHGDQRLGGDGAIVQRGRRPGVAYDRPRGNVASRAAVSNRGAVSLSGDEVQGARRGWTKRGAEGIVAHCEMLRVIPERRD